MGLSVHREVVLDIALRILSCVCIGYFALRAIGAFMNNPSRITLLFAVISEVTTIIISLASRRPAQRDWSIPTVVATVYAGSLFPALIDVEPGMRILNETVCAVLQAAGFLFAIHSKLFLGRSFGWLPADRGIVDSGPYRFVRHPIYFGYFIAQVGFLAANFSLQNALVYASLYAAQIYRIFMEERFLMRNEAYRVYAEKVRYRLIYGVF